ncbi:MAG: YbaB/EbfC family nucleoid-associated protein [Patescibacteria group bacterium]
MERILEIAEKRFFYLPDLLNMIKYNAHKNIYKEMFDQLKQLKELQNIKSSLEKEKVEIEKEGTRVVVNGKMEIEEIEINEELSKEKQEEILKVCINEGFKKIQMNMAHKMSQMDNFFK